MATLINIEVRTLPSGAKRYRPNWRSPDGARYAEPFADLPTAERFAGLVVAAGRHLPSEAAMRAGGFAAIADKHYPPVAAPTVATVADWCARYLDSINPDDCKSGTLATYRDALRLYIEPTALGSMPVTRTSPDEEDFRQWRNQLIASGGRGGRPLASSTVSRAVRAVLSPTMDMIARKGRRDPGANLPTDNPLDVVKPARGQRTTPRRRSLHTDADVIRLYLGACAVSPMWGDMLLTTLMFGLRWSEIAGLARAAFNWSAPAGPSITIEQIVDRHAGDQLVPATKTEAGYRTLIIPEPMRPMLRTRYDAASSTRDGIVFHTPTGRHWSYNNWRRDCWKPGQREAVKLGLAAGIDGHGLRRINLTELAASGTVPVKALLEAAGHTDPRMLAVYTNHGDAGRLAVAEAAGAFAARIIGAAA